jgi:hypothetical protein
VTLAYGDLGHNEKIELTAGAFNTFGLGISGAGFLGLLVNSDWVISTKIVVGCLLFIGTVLHVMGRSMLEDLR